MIILIGLVIVFGRWAIRGADKTGGDAPSLVRSWIAVSLVAGLLVFCVIAFAIDDQSLRSTLFGGLVTSVGAAVAFYFSAQTADKARQDVLNAAVGTVGVPDIVGATPGNVTVGDARKMFSGTTLRMVLDDPTADDTKPVFGQFPPPHTQVRSTDQVTVITKPPGR